MPRASRFPVKKHISGELNEHFASLISSLHNSSDIEQFFQDFLTKEEKIMLTKRLMLHLMLENGYKPFQIGAVLAMSRESIRVHGIRWSKGGATYKKIVGRIANREKAKRFWEKVEKILKPIDLAIRARTDMKARAQFASGSWSDD